MMKLVGNEIVTHLPELLGFVLQHSRTTCSDESPYNQGRCTRCDLLYIAEDAKIMGDDSDVVDRSTVVITIHTEGVFSRG